MSHWKSKLDHVRFLHFSFWTHMHDLDIRCEELIQEEFGMKCNFEVLDAVQKLERLWNCCESMFTKYLHCYVLLFTVLVPWWVIKGIPLLKTIDICCCHERWISKLSFSYPIFPVENVFQLNDSKQPQMIESIAGCLLFWGTIFVYVDNITSPNKEQSCN